MLPLEHIIIHVEVHIQCSDCRLSGRRMYGICMGDEVQINIVLLLFIVDVGAITGARTCAFVLKRDD